MGIDYNPKSSRKTQCKTRRSPHQWTDDAWRSGSFYFFLISIAQPKHSKHKDLEVDSAVLTPTLDALHAGLTEIGRNGHVTTATVGTLPVEEETWTGLVVLFLKNVYLFTEGQTDGGVMEGIQPLGARKVQMP